jgi:hypothetical protein
MTNSVGASTYGKEPQLGRPPQMPAHNRWANPAVWSWSRLWVSDSRFPSSAGDPRYHQYEVAQVSQMGRSVPHRRDAEPRHQVARQVVVAAAGSLLSSGVRTGAVELSESSPIAADDLEGVRGIVRGHPGSQLLGHAFRDRHRHRAALHLGSGVARGRSLPSRRRRPRLRGG